MLKRLIPFLAFVSPLLLLGTVRAQELPKELSVCELARAPKSFDGKLIRVRGTLSVHFEDFTLVEDCQLHQGIWLAFGGDVPGIVPSTINDNIRKRGVDVRIKGVSYRIQKDDNFRRLYALIAARNGNEPAYSATATLTGVFFAGHKIKLPDGQVRFMGYGHLGCCSLFVITRVANVDSVSPAELTVRGAVLQPDGRPAAGFVVTNDVRGGTPPQRQQTTTNDKGEFEFYNSGQILRFGNPEYRPVALFVETTVSPIDVKLEDAKRTNWVVRACTQTGAREKRVGFSVLFTLPKTIKYKRVDFGWRHSYSVFPNGKESYVGLIISHHNDDRAAEHISSVGYGQTEQRWFTDSTGAIVGIESWGHERDGTLWQNALFWTGDNARYNQESANDATALDRIIESACFAKK